MVFFFQIRTYLFDSRNGKYGNFYVWIIDSWVNLISRSLFKTFQFFDFQQCKQRTEKLSTGNNSDNNCRSQKSHPPVILILTPGSKTKVNKFIKWEHISLILKMNITGNFMLRQIAQFESVDLKSFDDQLFLNSNVDYGNKKRWKYCVQVCWTQS